MISAALDAVPKRLGTYLWAYRPWAHRPASNDVRHNHILSLVDEVLLSPSQEGHQDLRQPEHAPGGE